MLMREWESDEDRMRAAREYASEPDVWAKLLTECSERAGRMDPGGELRAAVGDAIDAHWTGRMVDLVAFRALALHSWRISASMLVGPSLRWQLATDGNGDEGDSLLLPTLRQVLPRRDGPDVILLLATPALAVPARLPAGAREARFVIGSLGGAPSRPMRELAERSGGIAITLQDDEDADLVGAAFCHTYRELAKDGGRPFRLQAS